MINFLKEKSKNFLINDLFRKYISGESYFSILSIARKSGMEREFVARFYAC